jgi:hypothetical protein
LARSLRENAHQFGLAKTGGQYRGPRRRIDGMDEMCALEGAANSDDHI